MKSISNILVALTLLLSFTAGNAQIKNAKTESIKIYGICNMCKATIEKAGNLKNMSAISWNKDTKMATITYDDKKTNQDEILKRIALSGYDSEKFLAPNDVYIKLPECCQYERKAQTVAKLEESKMGMKEDQMANNHSTETKQEIDQLIPMFDNYFAVKDALVQTNGASASEKAKALLTAINAVKMDKLAMDVHMVYMKVLADLKEDAEHISDTKDASHQRDHFMTLSKNMYALMKVSKYEQTIYYQFCPMANDGKGANWLSKENAIKNPYYGSQMLTCGKTVEIIK